MRKWVLGPEAWVRDRPFEEQPSTWGIWSRIETERFYLIEFNSYQFFSKSCWSNRFQALSNRLCRYQERSSKLKVRRTLFTNHPKILMWRHLRIAHKERTPSIIVVKASRFFKLSNLIGMCKLNFNVGKSSILKVVFFFCLTYNAKMLESKSMSLLS